MAKNCPHFAATARMQQESTTSPRNWGCPISRANLNFVWLLFLGLLGENRQMQRLVLTPLLIIAMLFGQSVCCCTLRLFVIGSTIGSQSTESSCCCTESGNTDFKCPHRSKDSGHKCPCKNGKTISARLNSDQSLPSTQMSDWCRTACQCESCTERLSVALVPTPDHFDSSAFPHLDRAGILRAVNSMRC